MPAGRRAAIASAIIDMESAVTSTRSDSNAGWLESSPPARKPDELDRRAAGFESAAPGARTPPPACGASRKSSISATAARARARRGARQEAPCPPSCSDSASSARRRAGMRGAPSPFGASGRGSGSVGCVELGGPQVHRRRAAMRRRRSGVSSRVKTRLTAIARSRNRRSWPSAAAPARYSPPPSRAGGDDEIDAAMAVGCRSPVGSGPA